MQRFRYILLRTLFLSLFIALTTVGAMAQRQKIRNLPYYDQRQLHWGFCLGLNMPDIVFTHSGSEAGQGWWATCTQVNPSFLVGLMGDLAISEHLNFRVSPSFYFQQRKVVFGRQVGDQFDTEEMVQQLKTSCIDIPVSLKVSTRRINNYRPYMVGGFDASFDLGHAGEDPIVFNRFDLGLHIGLGCDFYLPFFKFAPELRFNLGLLDMIDHDRNELKDQTMRPFTDAIQSARNKGISLILWFE